MDIKKHKCASRRRRLDWRREYGDEDWQVDRRTAKSEISSANYLERNGGQERDRGAHLSPF